MEFIFHFFFFGVVFESKYAIALCSCNMIVANEANSKVHLMEDVFKKYVNVDRILRLNCGSVLSNRFNTRRKATNFLSRKQKWSRSSNSIHILFLSFKQIVIWMKRTVSFCACMYFYFLFKRRQKIFSVCVKGETTTVKLP